MNPSVLLLKDKKLRDTIKGIAKSDGKIDYEAAQNYFDSLRTKVNEVT
jgi:hypothetical protein